MSFKKTLNTLKKNIFKNMERINGEPVIYLDINEEMEQSGLDAISFVETPATLTKWFRFSAEEKEFYFKKDEMKRVVTGPVMLAETPIKRIDQNGEGYWVKFSADTIFRMRNKYFKDNKIHNVNENHDGGKVVKDVYLVESFIVDEKTQTNLYPDMPVGTWMASFYVEDEKYWNDIIMSDKFNGFSLEGNFKPVVFSEQKKKNILEKIKDLFSAYVEDEESEEDDVKMFIDVKTQDGKILRISEIREGGLVKEITEDGEIDIENGDYALVDGMVLKIINGEIKNIILTEQEESEYKKNKNFKMKKKFLAKKKFEDAEVVDGGELVIVAEEIAVEQAVVVVDENLEVVENYSGELMVDEMTVVIEEGIITEVVEATEEGTEEEPTAVEEENVIEEMRKQFSEIKEQLNSLKEENKNLKGRFEKFAAEPSVEPTKTTGIKMADMNMNEKLKFFAKR
jgi:hypothetical protein